MADAKDRFTEEAEAALRAKDLPHAVTWALLGVRADLTRMQGRLADITQALRELLPGAACRGVPLADLGRDHRRIGEWAADGLAPGEPDARD
jgi:hypothetical protein